jgi:hypothetical protein
MSDLPRLPQLLLVMRKEVPHRLFYCKSQESYGELLERLGDPQCSFWEPTVQGLSWDEVAEELWQPDQDRSAMDVNCVLALYDSLPTVEAWKGVADDS